MSLDRLEAELGSIEPGADPYRWAFAAYRVAVARSETARSEDDVAGALGLLDRASRILTPTRSPVEYARVITAAANCHRQLSAPQRAAALFEEAADLLADRVAATEHAAALTNLGLARIELGTPERAVEPLTRAIDQITSHDDEARRVRGAALLNRAQAHQASRTEASLLTAIDDYRRAVADFDSEAPQRGMALHGLGAAILELLRMASSGTAAAGAPTIDDALDSFRASLRILTIDGFPFQHALAQHSLGIAYERQAAPFDLARALHCVEMSMSIFDPRLHKLQWQTAADALARIESGLAGGGSAPRITYVVRLLVGTSENERCSILRERLRRLSSGPAERTRREIAGLAGALVELSIDEYLVAVRSLVPVLMELPEPVLDAACAALCAAHQVTDAQEDFDGALDAVVHELLHGPQRVRVRDMLEQHGWVRP
ncbi:MAG: tetratricopeptide (TPR) repeat protein [Ilumatobacter sp.]